MKTHLSAATLVLFFCAGASPSQAACFPASSDVVSLGEASARAYAERRLTEAIGEREAMIGAMGAEVARIRRKALSCEPFPNILGADEWRCVGDASVCAKRP